MDWDLAQLRAYAATVDHGSLDGAAAALHVTPSAVSQRLKALERDRSGSCCCSAAEPVRTDGAGEEVLRLARQLRRSTGDTELSLGTGDLRPVVRLAVNADSLSTWVLPALAPLSAELSLELIREGEDHTADLLRDGSAMAAITTDGLRSRAAGRTPGRHALPPDGRTGLRRPLVPRRRSRPRR